MKNPALFPRLFSFADLPIRRKLMVAIMGVTTAALLISAAGLVIFDVLLFRGYLERDLSGLARITAENSTAALSFDDPASANGTLAALHARPHVTAACIYTGEGKLFARYSRAKPDAACPPPAPAEQVRMERSEITISHPIILAERRIGTLVLLYDLAELYQRIRIFGSTVLVMLLASGLVAFFLSTRVQRVIAAPISSLAKTAAAVSATRNYGLRAEKLSRDELGILVDGFNEMLGGIQSRDQDVRQALAAREEALRDARDARDFLRITLASIGDAVVSTDADGRVVFANPVACQLMRRTEEDIAGRPLDEILRLRNEYTGAAVESPVSRVLREGIMVALANHTVLIARDGSEIPIDDSAAPIRNHRGELIGAVLIFRDITERRRAENELRSAREQLQLVTDTMSPCVTHCSREMTFLWVSRSYADWLGKNPADLAGRHIADGIGPSAFAAIRPYIERVLAGERCEFERKVEYQSIGPRWIRAAYVPTHGRGGEVDGWVAHVSDITALKHAEAEVVRVNADLQRTNERLARSNEDLERFAFIASHDLQEPLRMITAYAQLLVRSYPAQFEGEGNMFVRNIVDGATRMRGLLADLLAYSEIDSDAAEPAHRVDLNEVLETVRQNLKVAVEEAGAEIASGPLPAVTGYTVHFVQLFQNLVANAIKYRGQQPPRIQISCERGGGGWRFAVADNGLGIDPEYHTRIFGIFKRLHGKKIPGTGIGLAICQRVVERYGGQIWVESERGRGATFCFTIPENDGERGERSNA